MTTTTIGTTLAEDVLKFWLDEMGPEAWYKGSPDIDEACRARFGDAVAAARAGSFRPWLAAPDGALAYLILTDQLPRNIHRDTALAFASDGLAFAGASAAVARGLDLRIDGVARQFFYLPYEHAENRQTQALSVALFLTRMPDDPDGNLIHALAHREIIRRFGRFPTRNTALGRRSSAAEERFLAEEGYMSVVNGLKAG